MLGILNGIQGLSTSYFFGYCWHYRCFVVVRASVEKTVQCRLSVGKNSEHCWD